MANLIHRIKTTIQEKNLIPANSSVVLGVSGGADSIALMLILNNLKFELNFELHIATLNHGIREDANDDIAFVQYLTEKYDLPLTKAYQDVPALAETHKESIESAARRARYNFFAQVAGTIQSTHIATAHHAGDQAETILLHLIRGAGTNGLTGMDYQSPLPNHPDLLLIRPLLAVSQDEINEYCAENELQPRIDSTNFDTTYRRNAIRHEILPQLRNINPQVDSALLRLADIVDVEQSYLHQQYKIICEPHITFGTRTTINLAILRTWHEALQRIAIVQIAEYHNCEITYEHVTDIIAQLKVGQVNTKLALPNNVRFRIGYSDAYFEKQSEPMPEYDYLQIEAPSTLKLGENIINDWVINISDTAIPIYDAKLAIPENSIISLRSRKNGDRWQPMGLNGKSQKLKKWFIDHKIPQHIRDKIPLLCVDDDIAAILLKGSWKVSEKYAVKHNGQSIFYFQLRNV